MPLASSYPISFQQKMQAAEHWQSLANEVANAIPAGRPIFVSQKHRNGFPQAFETYLKTALANRQIVLAPNPSDTGVLVLDYGVQRVDHTPFRNADTFPGIYTLAGTAAWLGYQGATHWGPGNWAV